MDGSFDTAADDVEECGFDGNGPVWISRLGKKAGSFACLREACALCPKGDDMQDKTRYLH